MALDRTTIPDAATAGSAIHARMAAMFPICRSITGDGLRETLRLVGRDVPLEMVETPTGTPGARLDCPQRVEHPRGMGRGAGRKPRRRLRGLQPPRPQLQRSGRRRRLARRAPRPRVHASRRSRSRSLSHLLLRRALGFLHEPEAARRARARGVPRRGRLDARARRRHLRRDARRREHRRRGRSHDLRVSPVPCERQPLRYRRPHRARTHARSADEPSLHVSVPVVARHDRCALLARTESRHGGADQSRPRSVLPRRPRAVHVQAQPARRRRDRQGGRERSRRHPGAVCSTGSRTGATSGSSAPRDSISRSEPSPAPRPTSSPNTTRRPTISISCGPGTSARASPR